MYNVKWIVLIGNSRGILLMTDLASSRIVKAMPEWWWAEARSDYNHLATLTRRVDSHISGMVLLSFATNLYFICIQLLFSFKYMILTYYVTCDNRIPSNCACFDACFLSTKSTKI